MDKVKSYIEKNKDRFLNELFELLRIPSISAQSDHKPDMTRCAEWLAASLMKAGADHAEVLPTEGNPVVFAERIVDPKAKTVLVYGHYDVMPVDPVDEWRTSPFEPVVKDGRIWCRGADDDKGQLFMHAKAFEAMCATDSLPCNVKFLLEGAKTENMTEKEQAKIVKSQEFTRKFEKAMDDDFNTPEAYSVLFELAREVNRLKGEGSALAAGLAGRLRELAGVLGLLTQDPEAFFQGSAGADDEVAEIEALIKARNDARAAKDEALLRSFELSGQTSEQEFAEMYGMNPRQVAQQLERARRRQHNIQ